MKTQIINFKGVNQSYSIFIGNNTLNLLPRKIKTLCPKTKKIALLIDTKIPNDQLTNKNLYIEVQKEKYLLNIELEPLKSKKIRFL